MVRADCSQKRTQARDAVRTNSDILPKLYGQNHQTRLVMERRLVLSQERKKTRALLIILWLRFETYEIKKKKEKDYKDIEEYHFSVHLA